MKIVFAKHKGNEQEFLFRVPNHINKIARGDWLLVDTMNGASLAYACSGIERASGVVAKKLGAYLPLKKVILKLENEYISPLQEWEAEVFEELEELEELED